MDIRSAPVFQRADQLIEIATSAMELLRAFPDHDQAREWRDELSAFRKSPSVYTMAKLIVTEKHADEDAIRANPETCPRCHGVGFFTYQGKTVKCGCPLSEARARGVSLEQDAIDRGIEDRPPDPHEGAQMMLLP